MLFPWETYSKVQPRPWVVSSNPYLRPHESQKLISALTGTEYHPQLPSPSPWSPRERYRSVLETLLGSLGLCGYLTPSILWRILISQLYKRLIIKQVFTNRSYQFLSILECSGTIRQEWEQHAFPTPWPGHLWGGKYQLHREELRVVCTTEGRWDTSLQNNYDIQQFSEKTGSSYLLTDGHGSDRHSLRKHRKKS